MPVPDSFVEDVSDNSIPQVAAGIAVPKSFVADAPAVPKSFVEDAPSPKTPAPAANQVPEAFRGTKPEDRPDYLNDILAKQQQAKAAQAQTPIDWGPVAPPFVGPIAPSSGGRNPSFPTAPVRGGVGGGLRGQSTDQGNVSWEPPAQAPLLRPTMVYPIDKPNLVPAPQSTEPLQIMAEEPPAQRPPLMLNLSAGGPLSVASVAEPHGEAAQAVIDLRDLLLGPAYGAKLKSDSGTESAINALLRASASFSTPEGIALMATGAGIASKVPELLASPKFAAALAEHPVLEEGLRMAAQRGVSGAVATAATVQNVPLLSEGIRTGNRDQIDQALAGLAIGGLAGYHALSGTGAPIPIAPGEVPPEALPGEAPPPPGSPGEPPPAPSTPPIEPPIPESPTAPGGDPEIARTLNNFRTAVVRLQQEKLAADPKYAAIFDQQIAAHQNQIAVLEQYQSILAARAAGNAQLPGMAPQAVVDPLTGQVKPVAPPEPTLPPPPPMPNAADRWNQLLAAWNVAAERFPGEFRPGVEGLKDAGQFQREDAWAIAHNAQRPTGVRTLDNPPPTPLPHVGPSTEEYDQAIAWTRQNHPEALSKDPYPNLGDLSRAYKLWSDAGKPPVPGAAATAGGEPGEETAPETPSPTTPAPTRQGRLEVGPDGKARIVYTETGYKGPSLLDTLQEASGTENRGPSLLDQVVEDSARSTELAQTRAPEAENFDIQGQMDRLLDAYNRAGLRGPADTDADAEEISRQVMEDVLNRAAKTDPVLKELLDAKAREAQAKPGESPAGQGTTAPVAGQPTGGNGVVEPETPVTRAASATPGATGPRVVPPVVSNDTGEEHDYSSTQANIPDPIAGKIREFAKNNIPASQLSDKSGEGEQQPHVTVRYGNASTNPQPVQNALAGEGPITATLGNASVFHTDDGDVLKVDVDSPDLHRLNAKLHDVPHTGETFPDYQPHVTIAYLKAGEGDQYDGKPIPGVTGQTITLPSVTFSAKDGKQYDIPLTGKASEIPNELGNPATGTVDLPRALDFEKRYNLNPAEAAVFNLALDKLPAALPFYSSPAEALQKEALRIGAPAGADLGRIGDLQLAKRIAADASDEALKQFQVGDKVSFRPPGNDSTVTGTVEAVSPRQPSKVPGMELLPTVRIRMEKQEGLPPGRVGVLIGGTAGVDPLGVSKAPPPRTVAEQPQSAGPPPSLGAPQPPSSGQTAAATPKLPSDLAGAKPRFNSGPNSFQPAFSNDLDKAAYITAQPTPSKRDADYLKFAMDHTGLPEAQVRQHGAAIRNEVKEAAKTAKPGTPTKPAPLDVPAHVWPESQKARKPESTKAEEKPASTTTPSVPPVEATQEEEKPTTETKPPETETKPPAKPTEFAVTGNTRTYKLTLRQMGGRWNPEAVAWIFPASKADELKRLPANWGLIVKPFGTAENPNPAALPPPPADLKWKHAARAEEAERRKFETAADYYSHIRAQQVENRHYIDGYRGRLAYVSRSPGAAYARRNLASKQHATETVYDALYNEVRIVLGQPAADRMRAEVEKKPLLVVTEIPPETQPKPEEQPETGTNEVTPANDIAAATNTINYQADTMAREIGAGRRALENTPHNAFVSVDRVRMMIDRAKEYLEKLTAEATAKDGLRDVIREAQEFLKEAEEKTTSGKAPSNEGEKPEESKWKDHSSEELRDYLEEPGWLAPLELQSIRAELESRHPGEKQPELSQKEKDNQPSAERYAEIQRQLSDLDKRNDLSPSTKHNRRVDLERELKIHEAAAVAKAQAEIDAAKTKKHATTPMQASQLIRDLAVSVNKATAEFQISGDTDELKELRTLVADVRPYLEGQGFTHADDRSREELRDALDRADAVLKEEEKPAKEEAEPETVLPIADYQPGEGNLDPEGRYYSGTLNNEEAYSDGYMLLMGQSPYGTVKRIDFQPTYDKAAEGKSLRIEPMAFSSTPSKEPEKWRDGVLQPKEAPDNHIWFDNQVAIPADQYDHILKRFPGSTFYQDPKKPSAPIVIMAKPAGENEERAVGLVMPLRSDIAPSPAVKAILENSPSLGASKPPSSKSPAAVPSKPGTIAKPEKEPTLESEQEPHATEGTDETEAGLPGAGGSESPAGAPSHNVRGAGEKRPTGSGSQTHAPGSRGGVRRPHPQGSTAEPGAGNEPGAGVPPKRKGSASSGRKVAADYSGDYQLTDADKLGEGSPREKAAANVAAIRILKQCEAEERPATPEEQTQLAKYTGWGATELAKVFSRYDYEIPESMKPIRKALDELLTPEEFKFAAGSTVNAHYTAPMVVKAMWDAMKRLGMQGGERLLEPAMGSGNFFGMEPDELRDKGTRTGIELDTITGGIAKLLYPGSNVKVSGFEKVPLANNFFDVAIGNVPFGNYGVEDPEFRDRPALTRSIHNYFFAKALDKVREGGVVAFVTSSYTMDSADPRVRQYLSEHADLLGAIRLPHNAFKENAGTQVTTDIIFLRKRAPNAPIAGEPWTDTQEIEAPDKRTNWGSGKVKILINEYYAKHPEMMLGQMIVRQGQRGMQVNALEGDLTPEMLAKAIKKLPKDVLQNAVHEEEPAVRIPLSDLPDPGVVKDGGYIHKDGQLLVREGNELKPAGLDATKTMRVRGMLVIRDAWRNVLKAQRQGTEAEQESARKLLNKAYDSYTRTNGPLNSRDNIVAFRGDPDAPGLLSLEDYTPGATADGGKTAAGKPKKRIVLREATAKKADIFRKSTNQEYVPPETAPDAASALAIALNEYGGIHWNRIQQLAGMNRDEAEKALLGAGLVYRNPEGGEFETADEYLSGKVRDKLKAAIAAAETDSVYEPNIEALKRVQPEDLKPGDIDARLGATWIPTDVIAQFLQEELGVTANVGHAETIAAWNVNAESGVQDTRNETKYGLKAHDWKGHQLVEDSLNLRTPTVRVRDPNADPKDHKTIVDPKATAALREKQQKLKDLFRKWIWQDLDRATRLSKIYNDGYNNLRLREFDGSHLKLPGSNAAIQLRPHQLNAVWRMLQGGNTLLAHCVGAGKSYEMIAGAMEMRRLGMAKKPVIIVPNHLVKQWAKEFARLYPDANLFVAGKDTFTGGKSGNRQKAMSRIANNDYDAVIVSHASFGKLPVSDATFNAWMDRQLKELEDAIYEMRAAEGERGPTVKDLQKAKKRLEAKIAKRAKREKKDNAINFEDLGIDQIFYDESHASKALYFQTKMTRIAGIPNRESDRAIDMFLKTQWLTQKRGGKGVVFATGTPISNTMAEMYTVMRFLDSKGLKESGLAHFDAWAAQYGEAVSSLELAPSGAGYRMNTRFARFVNLPELATAFRMFADVQSAEMLKLPTPRLKGGKALAEVAKASADQKRYIGDEKTPDSLVYRASHLPKGKAAFEPGADNMLAITGDGRKAALDMRLVNPWEYVAAPPEEHGTKTNKFAIAAGTHIEYIDPDTQQKMRGEVLGNYDGNDEGRVRVPVADPDSTEVLSIPRNLVTQIFKRIPRRDDPDSKVNKAVDKMVNIWKDHADTKATQLVFCDLSTPKPDGGGFSVYGDVRDKLIARGIPAAEIAFIHDYDSDEQKRRLFDAVNDGTIRILMGSTEKMGVGMNVQKRLIAMHHLDAPWRPSDIEQRDGRILRQGNDNEEVEIYRYITQGTFDAYMWQLLENKARFIAQVMSGRTGVRSAEDVNGAALTFAEMKGLASDNPLVREKIMTDSMVTRLDALRSEYENEMYQMRLDAAQAPRASEYMRAELEQLEADKATTDASDKLWHFGGETFEGEEASARAGAKLQQMLEADRDKLDAAHQAVYDKYHPLWVAMLERMEAAKAAAAVEGEAYVKGSKAEFKRTEEASKALWGEYQGAEADVNANWPSIPLGTYRGLNVFTTPSGREYHTVDNKRTYDLANLVIKGSSKYAAATNQEGNPIGTLASIRYHVEGIGEDIERLDQRIREQDKRGKELRELIARPFEHAEELERLLKRQAELNNELDINKATAGTEGIEQEAPPEEPEKMTAEEQKQEEGEEEEEGEESHDPAAPREARKTGKPGTTVWTGGFFRPKLRVDANTLRRVNEPVFRNATPAGRTTGAPKAGEIVLWAMWHGRPMLSDPQPYVGGIGHSDWFESEGLPTSGEDFDNLHRGFIQVGSDFLRMRGYDNWDASSPAFTPQSVIDEFTRKYPRFKDYRTVDEAGQAPGNSLYRPKLKSAPPPAIGRTEYFRAADAKYESLIPDTPGYVYLNAPAQAILLRALEGFSGEIHPLFDGLTVQPQAAPYLESEVANLEVREPDRLIRSAIAVLRQAIAAALKDSPIIVLLDGTLPRPQLRDARREEEFHRQQHLRAKTDPRIDHVDAERLNSIPAVRVVLDKIREHRPVQSEQEAFLELGAALASGDWAELGLTLKQAADAFEPYYNELVRKHGEPMRGILEYSHPHLKEEIDARATEGGRRNEGVAPEAPSLRPGPDSKRGPGRGTLLRPATFAKPAARPGPAAKPTPSAKSARQPVVHASPLLDSILAKYPDNIVATGLTSARDAIRRTFNPYAISLDANTAGLSLREHAAQSARSFAHAEEALKEARKLFAKRTWDENLDFINRVEVGDPQPTAALQQIADIMRQLLDSHRIAVQKLGKNKLTQFYENYFPHLWKRGKEAESIFRAIFGKRPIEGTKSFLKQRKFKSFQEGVDKGLVPVSENPVDLVLLKVKEMERYILAHRFLNEMKDIGLAKYVRSTSKKRGPEGWVKIPDQIGDVWGPPVIPIPEGHDKQFVDTLLDLAKDLGMRVERVAKLRSAWGRADQKRNTAKTRFAGPESVILHELGHLMDWKYGIAAQLVKDPEYKDELRKLADLRLVGNDTHYFQQYIRKGEEKIANMIAAYGHAPAAFQRVAPKTYAWFEKFIAAHPELEPLNKLEYGMQIVKHTTEYPVGGWILRGSYYMPPGAAQIIKNYLDPGLNNQPWYQILRGTSNTMLQFALGFSGFHAGFVTYDSMVSKLALAIQYLAAGKPLEAARQVASVPYAPISNLVRGQKIRNAYLRGALNDPALAKYVDAMISGGARITMDAQYRTKMRQSFLDAVRKHNADKMALTGIPAIAELAMWPVLEWLVPRMKVGMFADMVDFELRRLGPDASQEQVRAAFAGAWDSVDNRMGQLVYDNLFWNRTMKDLMMISVQSVGWNMGTVRELGGAAVDLGRYIRDMADNDGRGGTGGGSGGSGSGRIGAGSSGPAGAPPHPGNPQFTRRMAYALALIMLTGMTGALTDYVNTKGRRKKDGSIDDGHDRDWRDYFFPRTGNVDEHGHEERMTLPGYFKDLVSWYMEPANAARNKLSPIVRWIAETISNRNFYNEKIWDGDNNTVPENVLAELKHVGSFFVPMSLSGLLREKERGAGGGMQAGQMLGVRTAPSYVTNSAAERYMAELPHDRTSAPTEMQKIERDIEKAARANRWDRAMEIGDKALAEGRLTNQAFERAIKSSQTDPLVTEYNRLSLTDAIHASSLMTPEERERTDALLDKKIGNAIKKAPWAEIDGIYQKLDRAGIMAQIPAAPTHY